MHRLLAGLPFGFPLTPTQKGYRALEKDVAQEMSLPEFNGLLQKAEAQVAALQPLVKKPPHTRAPPSLEGSKGSFGGSNSSLGALTAEIWGLV